VLGWPPAMFFSSSTCQAFKKNLLSKFKYKPKHTSLEAYESIYREHTSPRSPWNSIIIVS